MTISMGGPIFVKAIDASGNIKNMNYIAGIFLEGVNAPFCPGYCVWASGPSVSKFEFGPRTYSVVLFILLSL